jgi:hypothetical protein
MIINNPTSLDAMQAGRLAQRCYELTQALQATLNTNVADALDDMAKRRMDHHQRTGWTAHHDGANTVYHYTNPGERPQL